MFATNHLSFFFKRKKNDTRLVANIQTVFFSSLSDLVKLYFIRLFLAAFRDLKSAIFGLKSGFLAFFLNDPL